MKHIPLLLIATLLFFSCKKEVEDIPIVVDIKEEFIPYVNTFIAEGKARGIDVDPEETGLTVRKADLLSQALIGLCNSRGNIVEVDSTIWEQSDEFYREYIIYHELGHCLLGRPHRSDKFPSGQCRSIMGDGNELVDEFCSVDFISDNWRTYYFDELFDEPISIPNWYNEHLIPTQFDSNQHEYIANEQNISVDGWGNLTSFEIKNSDDFTFSAHLKNIVNSANTITLYINFHDVSVIKAPLSSSIFAQITTLHKTDDLLLYKQAIENFENNLTFTIQYKDNLTSFFINEKCLHQIANIDWEEYVLGNSIGITGFSGSFKMDYYLFVDK